MSSIELRLQQTKEDNIVQVLDDGAGVPKEELIGLGQRGLRLDEQTPGHGIGLAIVQEIVTRYGGKLEFSTTPDAKFCVTVKLPKHLFEASAYSQEV